jgi:hypothetical protein
MDLTPLWDTAARARLVGQRVLLDEKNALDMCAYRRGGQQPADPGTGNDN